MNTSLRDQLLKVGLVTEKQAKQAAAQEQQRQYRDHRAKQPPGRHPQQGGSPGGQSAKGQPGSRGGVAPQGQSHQNQSHQGQPRAGQSTQPGQPPLKQSAAVQQAQAAKVARDQELNRRREDKAQRKARIAQIEQMIEQNRLPRLETEDHYSFIDGKKIRRMSVDPQRREQLTSGVVVIVRYKGHYAVVPKETAERIRERDENMVVPHLQAKAQA